MIKVEVVKGEGTTELFFELRNTSDVFLADLDSIYAAIVGGKVISSGYLNTSKLSIKIADPVENSST